MTVGSVALNAVESFVHIKHSGTLIGKDAKCMADVIDAFWATFCDAAHSLVVSLNDWNECPMAPDEQLIL